MARHKRTRIERGIYTEERPDGDRLIVRVQVEGRDRSKTLHDGATLGDARRLRREMEAANRKPAFTPAAGMTVRLYAKRWIRGKAATVRTSTLDHYVDVIGRHLLPAVIDLGDRAVVFGDLEAHRVRRVHAVAWVAWAARQRSRMDQPYSTATLDSWWRPVKGFLRDLAADFAIDDPTVRVSRPRSTVHKVRDGRTLTVEQLARLLTTIDRSWPQWATEVRVLATTGMRPGELYALRWMDIRDATGIIAIERNVRRGVVELPKNGKTRTNALTARLRVLLARHRMASGNPAPDDLVFPAVTGGFRGVSALGKMLRLASLEAGIPLRVGALTLRRTFNTLNSEIGASGVVLRSQMGHSTVEMTHRYAGVHLEAKRKMVEQLEAKIDG